LKGMRGLHGERHADAERRQRNHWSCAHADEHHLPKDRRDFEQLAFERCDQNPVEQTEVEFEVVFQDAAVRTAENDKAREMAKAESSAAIVYRER
jgi:hypothetical protein